jgi:hypothetical protein
MGGLHANPMPGHTYSVALLEKKKSLNSADTSVAQTRRVDANVANVRNMMKRSAFCRGEEKQRSRPREECQRS